MAVGSDNFSGTIGNFTSSTAFRMSVSGGTFRANASGDPALEYWNGFTPGDAQYAKCTIVVFETAANLGIGPIVRADTASDTGYWFFHNTVDEYRLVYLLNGAISVSIGSYTAGTPALGDVMEIRAVGTSLECYVNGVLRISGSNASRASGRVGVRSLISSVVAQVDDFEGGDLLQPSVAISGTATASITEADIVAGGETIIATLTDATWLPATEQLLPTLVGTQTNSFAGTTAAQTITFTTVTPLAGDLVIIGYSVGSTADRSLAIRNTGAVDYTLIGSELYSNDTFDSNLRVAYRFMPGTPETQFVLTETALGGTGNAADAGVYSVRVYRNVNTGTVLDVAAVTDSAANQSSRVVNPSAITPTTAGAKVVVFGSGAGGTGGTYTTSDLSNFIADTQVDTNDAFMASGDFDWTSGAFNPAAFGGGGTSTTNDSWASVTLALRPVAATTPFATIAAPALTAGCDSAQSEANGWNVRIRDAGAISWVRTSDTVATGTLAAAASYDITAQETITVTVDSTAISNGGPLTGTPTLTVDASAGGVSVTPASGALTATGFGPTVTASDHKSVSPAQGALTATGFAPTVFATNPQSVTPATGALAATGFAPSVVVGNNQNVTPASGALTLTGHAPTVAVTNHIAVAPGAGALVATGFAPTVTALSGAGAAPAAGILALEGFAPTVVATAHVVVVPSSGTLTAQGFAPSVDVTVDPPVVVPGHGGWVQVTEDDMRRVDRILNPPKVHRLRGRGAVYQCSGGNAEFTLDISARPRVPVVYEVQTAPSSYATSGGSASFELGFSDEMMDAIIEQLRGELV